ncbi:MAG: hypothetical protein SFU86_10715 [Pirellulaceae bacterium]|nr:hypothetical protein [Pirellulaceae bacterium]
MTDQLTNVTERHLHEELGLKRLSPGWAKGEIFLGLATLAAGNLAGVFAIVRLEGGQLGAVLAASIVLQTLGGYLAMAGHRSHLYQSQNKLTAWLADRIKKEG